METFKTESAVVQCENNQAMKDALYQKLLDFFKKHEAFCGESVCQCDEPQIEAPELLGEVADEIFKFNVEWKD